MNVAYLLILISAYVLGGLAFAVPFVLVGVGKIDPHAAHGSAGFRLLIFPGTVMLWPLLARRWLKGIHTPPEEKNAHRCAASAPRGSRREEALSSANLNRDAAPPIASATPQSALRIPHLP